MDEERKKANEIQEGNRKIILEYVEKKKLPEPRALTRKERKQLDEAGINLFKIRSTDKRTLTEIREDCAEWIADNIYPKFNFDNVPNHVFLWFGSQIFGMTYKDELAEKN